MKQIRQNLTWQLLIQLIGASLIAYGLYLGYLLQERSLPEPKDWEWVLSMGQILLGLSTLFASRRVPATPILATLPAANTAAGWLRYRENSLMLLQHSKVDPVLRNDLARLTLELGMEYAPYAVARTLETRDAPPQPIPADKTMPEVFVEAGRRLLLLGAPGSGKTFSLMQLAQALIDQARQDETRPMPLIFNLASWDGQHDNLLDWLEAQVRLDDYPYIRNVANWIAHNQLILLLDGLDEVAAGRRAGCLGVVNAFAEQYPTELVLVSRQLEYDALG